MSKEMKKKNRKVEDKMSQAVNSINQKMSSLELKMRQDKKKGRNLRLKELQSTRLSSMRKNPQYQAMISEYAHNSALPARVSGEDNPIADADYIASVVRKHVMTGSSLSFENARASNYLKSLVDPEGCGANSGVPDSYPDPTYRYQSIVELNVGAQYFTTGGHCSILTCPDIVDHVLLPAPSTIGERYSLVNAIAAPYGRLTDMYDTNLVNPDDCVLANTPSYRTHLDANINFTQSPSVLTAFCVTNITALLTLISGHAYVPMGSDTPLYGGHALITKLNPGRLLSYPSDNSLDDQDNMWSIDSEASVVDKLMFPSSVPLSNGNNIVGYPFFPVIGGNITDGFGTSNLSDVLIGSYDIDVTLNSDNFNPTLFAWPVNSQGCSIYVLMNFHGVELGTQSPAVYTAVCPCQIFTELPVTGTTVTVNVSGSIGRLDYSIAGYTAGPAAFATSRGMCAFGTPPIIAPSNGTNWIIDETSITVAILVGGGTESSVWLQPNEFSFRVKRWQVGIDIGTSNTVASRESSTNPVQVGAFMGAFAVDELTEFSSGLWSQYRLVSQSSWLTYVGGTLNDIGEVYGALIEDRRYAADRDHNYLSSAGIATVRNAYRGKAPLGAYAIWKPTNSRDIEFRSLPYRFNFNAPFTSLSIESGTVRAAANFVLRVVSNWEVQTLAAIYRDSLRESVIDPTEMMDVFRIMQHFPPVMANDDHQSAISSFFSSLWSGIKSAGKGIIGALPTLMKVGEAAAPLFA
jgi:hypothetical protein